MHSHPVVPQALVSALAYLALVYLNVLPLPRQRTHRPAENVQLLVWTLACLINSNIQCANEERLAFLFIQMFSDFLLIPDTNSL